MRCYKFQLKPTKKEEIVLNRHLNICRFGYNQLLAFMTSQEKVDKVQISHHILELKKQFPELKTVYSKTLQYEVTRLLGNLKGLGVKKQHRFKVGRLRFKGKNWFKTIVYNQSGFKIIQTNNHYDKLHLSKIGDIKICLHREIIGNIKSIIIKKKVFSWEAHIITDGKYELNHGDDIIGLDMGIINFIVTSENERVDNPLYMNRWLKKLQYTHRKISQTKKGSRNRKKFCLRLQYIWERINNQRTDFFHKQSIYFINKSKFIAVEKLNIKNMVLNKNNKYHNHRNILDSSWGRFLQMLEFKAERAGILYVKVNPRNTSKQCHQCLKLNDIHLSMRKYYCKHCGILLDRDQNAAMNIKRKGLASVGDGRLRLLMNQEATSLTAESS